MAQIVTLCARGTEPLVESELLALGVTDVTAGRAQVTGEADYAAALRVCLWSRVASRVLWPIAEVEAPNTDALYNMLKEVPFEEHLDLASTFAVDATLGEGTGPTTPFSHSQYVTLRVKDAIVDRLREIRGARPDVDRERPDVRFHVHVANERAWLSIDLAGEALHRRGYRTEGRAAPLKENLAAALLLRMEWPRRMAEEPLCDPMCGSGTILIEAGLMLGDRAPGLLRQRWGFAGWKQHDDASWQPIIADARERARAGLKVLDAAPRLFGFDAENEAIPTVLQNAKVAGLEGRIVVEPRAVADLKAPSEHPGLVLTNPPYGERLGEVDELATTYRELGDVLKRGFPGWTSGIFTAQGPLVGAIGLRPTRRDVFWNGPIECRLLTIPISVAPIVSTDGPGYRKVSQHSEMFANRLEKNLKHLGKWAKREDVSSFRVYDADLPEYAVAVDLYNGTPERAAWRGEVDDQRWAHVQEYAPPSTVDAGRAESRLRDVLARLPDVLHIPPERVVHKLRRKQKPTTQYQAGDGRGERTVIREGGHRFLVNLHDYLDTGLYLDQRQLRARLGEAAKGRTFLNLFCYTGSATVYARNASETTSVDLSNTYLAWAEENFALNRLDPKKHRVVKDDCLHWMEAAIASGARYDVIFLAPPTFSNSKGMGEATLDVQRDHTALLAACGKLLAPDGLLYFVNHFRRFKMAAPEELAYEELTKRTLPPDYQRDARFHNAWLLRHK